MKTTSTRIIGLTLAAALTATPTIALADTTTPDPGSTTPPAENTPREALTQLVGQADTWAKTDAYTTLDETTKTEFDSTLAQARTMLDDTAATETQLTDMVATLNDIYLKASRVWKIGKLTLGRGKDGTLTRDLTMDATPKGLTATTGDNASVTLTKGDTEHPSFGVSVTEYTFAGDTTTPAMHVTVTVGSTIGLKDPDGGKQAFAWDKDKNQWTLDLDQDLKLDKTNTPETKTITLANGDTADITWGKATESKPDKGAGILFTATGAATGTLKDGTAWTVNVTAKRTWDTHLTVNLTRTSADGTTMITPLGAADDAATLAETITGKPLPHDQVGDAYALDLNDKGADLTDATVTPGLDAKGERTWNVKLTWTDKTGKEQSKTIAITQGFETAPRQSANPDAALKSLFVNGSPISGWDPDTLDYTIVAKGQERYQVSPQAADGQTVSAGDVRQTMYTTVQEWTVTKNGQSRTYTVTVVRPHDKPTADEAFTPADPRDADGVSVAPTPGETRLKSVGYMLDGKYVTADKDDYQVPEHATLAYASYAGQHVVVTSITRVKGMTWRYEFSVLSPDGTRTGTRTLTVTYLTRATHAAGLTGVKFDGTALSGFQPDKHEYTVDVANADRYVITPLFDGTGGMSVATHKDGRDATVTAVSADGLTTVVYRFHARTRNTLASTGSATLTLGVFSLLSLLAGLGLRMRRRS